MFPTPLPSKPIKILSLVQLNVSEPAVFALNGIAAIAPPEQTTTSLTAVTIGVGLIVIVKVLMFAPALVQPSLEAVTVIVPTILTPVLFEGAV